MASLVTTEAQADETINQRFIVPFTSYPYNQIRVRVIFEDGSSLFQTEVK